MKFALVLLCALASQSAAENAHPIEKVIGLLKDLKAKAIAQGKEEAVAYEKFTYWCSTSKSELNNAIAESKETIAELEDTISGQKKQEATLKAKIEKLETEIGDLQASAKSAKEDRDEESKLYEKASKDLDDTVKAVGDCIKALEDAETKTESMMLAQRKVKGLIALLARADPKAAGDLKKHTDKYDFKSENVIELLKQLKMKFEDDLTAAIKAETNSLNSYSLSKAARDNAIDAAKKSKEKKEKTKAATEKARAQAESDLKNTQSDLSSDSDSLKATDESCATKASEWAARSKTRSGEIEAMDVAVGILGKATGVRTEAPGNPIPPASPVKLLQIASVSVSDPKMKAVALLRSAAKDAHSRALESLAMEVSAHLNGPFDAVNGMIEKMIFRLMDEQKKEDEHKLWCDQEIEKTNTMKEDKDDKISELNAEIKEETAAVSKLTDEIAEAEKMITDIVGFVNEATEIRNVGKKENKAAIKDSQDAQTAVTNAISVLEAFYKDSGAVKKEPWEFIQKPIELPKNPATWDSEYTGVSDPKKQPGGIITVLENINADFSKMEAETKSQEQVDQKEFEDAMKANDIEKARRTKESEMKNAEKSRRIGHISSLQSEKKNVAAELEKTEQYLEDLKPACVDGDSKYEDRKAARAKEIAALQKAQVTLRDAFKEKKEEKFLQKRVVSRHF